MKIALLTITWRRPRLLGRLIKCFEEQTYDDREMIILDDDGAYPDQPSGDRWRVVSFDRRFYSLGAKRNACAALASPDADAFLICDDDDFLFPWAMAATANALSKGRWAQPREVFEWSADHSRLERYQTFSVQRPNYIDYHSGWSYRRETFEQMNGYPISGEEDSPVRDYLTENIGPSINTICPEFPDPFVIYGGEDTTYRISHLYQAHRGENMWFTAWNAAGRVAKDGVMGKIEWDRPYLELPRPPKAKRRMW